MTFKQLNARLKTTVEGLVSKKILLNVATQAKNAIVSRTSKGFGVKESGGPAQRLPGLSESYKKQRRRLKRQGQLSGDTSPNRSNLTKTKQMLNSVDARATNNYGEVFLNNKEANDKAQYQADAGREFMNLSKKELANITREIEKAIKNDIKKNGL